MNQYITLYKTCGLLFGSYITGVNLYNIPYKKIKKLDYPKKQQFFLKYFTVCLFKGCIYGLFIPLSIFASILDPTIYLSHNPHKIPCCVYFRDDEKNFSNDEKND